MALSVPRPGDGAPTGWALPKVNWEPGKAFDQFAPVAIEEDVPLLIVRPHQSQPRGSPLGIGQFRPGKLYSGSNPTQPLAGWATDADTPVIDIKSHQWTGYPKRPPPAAVAMALGVAWIQSK